MTTEVYYLYPRLPQYIAQQLAESHVSKPLSEMLGVPYTSHESATFAPTGGNRVQVNHLKNLRADIVDLAEKYRFPNSLDKNSARLFDTECCISLHQRLRIHPSEASRGEVWSFLACVLMPDIVRWRFSDSTDIVRFVGRERGMRRHAFGRLWWRAYLAYSPKWKHPYDLLWLLNEDDFVQVTERSSIAVRPALFQAFCSAFDFTAKKHGTLARRDLIREASKRMYRLLSLVAVEALNEYELRSLINDVFAKTADALSQTAEVTP
jgi:hypothetical protein